MKGNLLKQVCVAISIAFPSTINSWAGPLRGGDVPQQPAWVAHVDFDSLRSNAIGKFLLAEIDKPDNQPKIEALTAMFGVDIRTQIHGITVFGPAESREQPVLLIYGDFDTNRLTAVVKSAREYDGMEHGQHTIHSWLDEKKKRPDGSHPRIYAALPSSTLLIFSPGRQGVADALDVLDKKAESLAANKAYANLLKLSDKQTFLQAAAPKIILPAGQARNPIAELTTHVQLTCRAGDDDQVTGVLKIGGRDDEVARNMASIAEGITGLLKAQHERPKLSELAAKVSVKQSGSDLSVTFAGPADQVIELLKFAAAAKHKG